MNLRTRLLLARTKRREKAIQPPPERAIPQRPREQALDPPRETR